MSKVFFNRFIALWTDKPIHNLLNFINIRNLNENFHSIMKIFEMTEIGFIVVWCNFGFVSLGKFFMTEYKTESNIYDGI